MPASPSVLRSVLEPHFADRRCGRLFFHPPHLLFCVLSLYLNSGEAFFCNSLSRCFPPRLPPCIRPLCRGELNAPAYQSCNSGLPIRARLALRHAFCPCVAERINTPASMDKPSCLAFSSCTLGIRSTSLSLIAHTLALCPCAAESLTVSASFPCPPLRASHPALRPVLAQQEFDFPALAQLRVSSSGPRRPLFGSYTVEDSARQPHISSLTVSASLTARYSAAPCPTGR